MPDANLTFLNPLRRGGEEGNTQYARWCVRRKQRVRGGSSDDAMIVPYAYTLLQAMPIVNLDFFLSFQLVPM